MHIIKNLIGKLNSSQLGKNLGVMLGESILTRGLNFVIILILTRLLGPEEYGKFSLIFIIWSFCFQFFDFGMENTVMRFSAKNSPLRPSILGAYFLIKASILSAVFALLYFFGANILTLVHKESISEFIPFIILAILAESLFFTTDIYFQSKQQFKIRSILNISRYVLNLLFMVALASYNQLTINNIVYMYFITLGISLIFSHKICGFVKSIFQKKLDKTLVKEMLNYQKWMGTLAVSNTILQRIDVLMITILGTFSQIGIYNAAFQLSAIVSFLPYIFSKVLLPKMSELQEAELFIFIKRLYKPLSAICLLIIFAIPIADKIIPLLIGNAYSEAIPIFNVLILTFVISFIAVLIEQALYALGKPKIMSLSKYVQIVLIVLISALTITNFGIIWAAIAVLISKVLYTAIITIEIIKTYTIHLEDIEPQTV